MSLSNYQTIRLAALLGAGCLLWASLPAQVATNLPPAPQASAAGTHPLLTRPPTPPEPAPSLPTPRSPISFFRELLDMPAADREQALTNRSPEARRLILAKVHEYESLQPDQRKLRLSVTELRWYLRPLMTASPTNRLAQLAMIPANLRLQVQDRLREWDKLPPEAQKGLLDNEATISYLTEMKGMSDKQRHDILDNLSPERRELLEKGINRWAEMSDEQRRDASKQFTQFFELTAQEKEKAIKALPAPERPQVEKMMQIVGNLSPEQRSQYMTSFAKFASLSLVERQRFLQNAERWKQMSPSEKQAWRDLVRRLPPPIPRRPPPLPPPVGSARPAPAMATNGG
jgi:hypothetical protein